MRADSRGMPLSFLLAIMAVGAFFSGAVASAKHRSVAAWSILGACFPLIAAVAICCVPERKLLEEAC